MVDSTLLEAIGTESTQRFVDRLGFANSEKEEEEEERESG